MERKLAALITTMICFGSCSAIIDEDRCLNEIDLAPMGSSEVSLSVAKYEGLAQRDIIFISDLCPGTRPIGKISFETRLEIEKWLELNGEPLDEVTISAAASFWIFKFGEGDREFFVTHFKGGSEEK